MEEFCPHLYYWDGADGPNWQGWWLSPEVGSDSFMAFANGDIECPEKATNWRSGEGGIDLRVGVISSGPPSIVGVRAPTMMGLEGAYRDDGTTHDRGAGRRIYKRYRDLHADEVAGLDEPAVVTYSSAFTLNSLPSPIADISPVQQQQQQQQAIIGVAVGAALDWVNGGDGSGIVQGVALSDAEAERGAPSAAAVVASSALVAASGPVLAPVLSARIECAADLEQLVTKREDEVLSVPELHDEDSPLPMGWVVAARGVAAASTTRTVAEHLLHAVDELEHGVAPEIAALAPVRRQVERVRGLLRLVEGPFTVCVWSGT